MGTAALVNHVRGGCELDARPPLIVMMLWRVRNQPRASVLIGTSFLGAIVPAPEGGNQRATWLPVVRLPAASIGIRPSK